MRGSIGQKTRNRFMQTIKDHIELTNSDIHINLHSTGNLRASSGKTGIQIQLWIDKDNSIFLGATFGNLEAKRILMELLQQKGEYIRAKTGHKFEVHQGKGNPGYGWIFSEIIYDMRKPIEHHVELFSSQYVTLIRLLRDLIQDI